MTEKWQASWWEFFAVTVLSPLGKKKNRCAANISKAFFRKEDVARSCFPPVVMAAVLKLEMGLNPWPVSSFAFSGLSGTAPDENGARAQTYEWLFVWWSDTITNWVTQLTASQSDAQFDSCMLFFFTLSLFFESFPSIVSLQWKDKWSVNVNEMQGYFFFLFFFPPTANNMNTRFFCLNNCHNAYKWSLHTVCVIPSFPDLPLFCSGLLGCRWRVIRFSRGLRGFQCLPMAAVRQASAGRAERTEGCAGAWHC